MSEERALYEFRNLVAAARRIQADINEAGMGPSTEPSAEIPQLETTNVLAIALYLQAQLTEGQLSRKLGVDRIETRSRVAEFLNTAIENAGVPIKAVSTLETRLATATGQATRLLDELAAERMKNHDLRNEMTRLVLGAEERQLELEAARQDLAAERQHVIELAGVAEYAWVLASLAPIRFCDSETDQEVSAEELRRLAGEALGKEEAK